MDMQKEIDVFGRICRHLPYGGHTRAPGDRAKKPFALLALAMTVGLAMSLFSQGALAADPTYSIDGPNEFDLPIVPSATVFVENGLVQTSSSQYDAQGNRKDLQTAHVFAGVTRFVHLFSFESLPKVGFYLEVLQPTVATNGPGTSSSGLGDTLVSMSAYIKPTPQMTVGFQNLVSVPIGSSEESMRFWETLPGFYFHDNIGKFAVDSIVGAGIASSQHLGGADTAIGNTYFLNIAGMYNITNRIAPFVNFNYQVAESSRDHATGAARPGASVVFGCADNGSCHEDVLGGGVKFAFTPTRSLALWYAAGVDGQNTVRTNAVFLEFIDVW